MHNHFSVDNIFYPPEHRLFSEKHDAVSVQTRKIALSMRDAFSSAEFSIIISLQIFQTSYNIEYSVIRFGDVQV